MSIQPAIEPKLIGCLCCGVFDATLSMDARIGVGFGYAALTCDGVELWTESPGTTWQQLMTVGEAEKRAARQPKSDWRIVLYGPLCGRVFQRHGKGKWCLIEETEGFA